MKLKKIYDAIRYYIIILNTFTYLCRVVRLPRQSLSINPWRHALSHLNLSIIPRISSFHEQLLICLQLSLRLKLAGRWRFPQYRMVDDLMFVFLNGGSSILNILIGPHAIRSHWRKESWVLVNYLSMSLLNNRLISNWRPSLLLQLHSF